MIYLYTYPGKRFTFEGFVSEQEMFFSSRLKGIFKYQRIHHTKLFRTWKTRVMKGTTRDVKYHIVRTPTLDRRGPVKEIIYRYQDPFQDYGITRHTNCGILGKKKLFFFFFFLILFFWPPTTPFHTFLTFFFWLRTFLPFHGYLATLSPRLKSSLLSLYGQMTQSKTLLGYLVYRILVISSVISTDV